MGNVAARQLDFVVLGDFSTEPLLFDITQLATYMQNVNTTAIL